MTTFGGSRAEVAASRLAAVAAKATPGERLGTKEEVRSSVDVSLGTFNETLRLLQTRGIVTVRPGPGGGVFVAEQSPMVKLGNALLGISINRSVVTEAVRIRNALEPLIVEDACQLASDDDVAAMRAQIDAMRRAVDDEDGLQFLHANWELHSRIARTGRSEMLASLYRSLLDLESEHTVSIQSSDHGALTRFHQERLQVHADLVEAIAARDAARALDVVEEHNRGIEGDAPADER